MSDKTILVLEFSIELAYVLVGMIGLFGGKIKRPWIVAMAYIGFAGYVCLNNAVLNEDMIEIVGLIGCTLVYVVCFLTIKPDAPPFIKWLIVRVAVLSYIEELVNICIDDIIFLFNVKIQQKYIYTIVNLSCLLLIIILERISKRTHFSFDWKKTPFIRKSMLPLLIFFLTEIMMLIVYINILIAQKSGFRYQLIVRGLSLLSMISIAVFVVIVLYVKKSNEHIEQLLEQEMQIKQYQTDYYETLLEKEAETRKYRHDLKGHLVFLNSLADDNNTDKIKEYVKEMYAHMERVQHMAYCTDIKSLDVFINHYCTHLEGATAISVTGKSEHEIAVSEMEQCMIFSNLIKNAVEAIGRMGDNPTVFKVKVVEGKDNVSVTITNSFNENDMHTDSFGKLLTSKKDKKNHGIGLNNIRDTVAKNNGSFHYNIRNHEFICEVILPIKKSGMI